ncbi:hypothetical protein [Rhizobium sp. MHM7A]|uniref:hypothetical protein n=1 Tax=Rhizobium sp. MHM7A TaxID=2583233 RepID=UPI001106A5E2|nr:hypothetical protein [Rhizobium sp. MHM7A]TLX16672.1 hypothetical protein FFR93_04840 [Rhizobium sp. MHM7A]
MMRTIPFAIAFLCLTGIAQAAEVCYVTVTVDQPLECTGGYGGGSADFTGGCSYGPEQVQVPIACPPKGRWVNIPASTFPMTNPAPTQAKVCASYGMKASSWNGKTCASGERRPTSGTGWESINYRYGIKGGGNGGDGGDKLVNIGGKDAFGNRIKPAQMCYDNKMGAKNDTKQDASVAVFCE